MLILTSKYIVDSYYTYIHIHTHIHISFTLILGLVLLRLTWMCFDVFASSESSAVDGQMN